MLAANFFSQEKCSNCGKKLVARILGKGGQVLCLECRAAEDSASLSNPVGLPHRGNGTKRGCRKMLRTYLTGFKGAVDFTAGVAGPFYVISSFHITRNRRYIRIADKPGRTNLSHEKREFGWLGQTDDVTSEALGKSRTLAEAIGVVADEIAKIRGIGVKRYDPGYIAVMMLQEVRNEIHRYKIEIESQETELVFDELEMKEYHEDLIKGGKESIERLQQLKGVLLEIRNNWIAGA